MITIVNYGMGNIGSIVNMLKKIGTESIVTSSPEDINRAEKIILPGVGSFDNGIKNLNELNLIAPIKNAVIKRQIPILGICLGMQLLGRMSEEGSRKGLDLIPFDNVKFNINDAQLKLPHMGWDVVKMCRKDDLTADCIEKQRYYFVHSYHAVCEKEENILMTCDYGYPFPAAVKQDLVYGVQFHPEKSHIYGMRLLENFIWRI